MSQGIGWCGDVEMGADVGVVFWVLDIEENGGGRLGVVFVLV